MHVLHIIDSLGIGGAERMLVDLANATVADGKRVSVCVTRSDTTLAAELDPRIELLVLRRTRRISLSASRALARWARERKVDVLHVHMRSSLAFVLLLRATRLLTTPIVFHDHYGKIEIDRSVPRWLRFGYRWIGHYVGVSDQLREWAIAVGVPASKATTIGNGLDLRRLTRAPNTRLRDELAVPASDLLAVLVASFKREKGIDRMIDAVARSRARDRLTVAVLGAGTDTDYADECRARLRAHGLEHKVHMLGARNDVPVLLAGADLGLMSSLSESGPLVLIEYLAAALPIVATRVGDISRRLAARDVAGFVAPDDPAEFAAALDALVDLPADGRLARGRQGRAILAAEWDIRASLPRWYEAYDSAMIAEPSAPRRDPV